MSNYLHISFSIKDDCINLSESYGTICVKCNACGRIDKSRQKEDALKMYNRQLEKQRNFNKWVRGSKDIQKKNIAENIKYIENKIKEIQEEE